MLRALDITKVQRVPFKGQTAIMKVMEVVDGDTIWVCADYLGAPLAMKIRIRGVDTPESSHKYAKSELEVLAGKKATTIVCQHITPEQYVKVFIKTSDPYFGRYVGDIYLDAHGCWLSEYILDTKIGRAYSGDKKTDWDVALLQSIIDI